MTWRIFELGKRVAQYRRNLISETDNYRGFDGDSYGNFDSYLSSVVVKNRPVNDIKRNVTWHGTKKMKYHQLYMDIAIRVSEMSYADRLHVGAVVVKDGRIISMGWNGMPTGWDNACEREQYNSGDPFDDTMETKKEVLHAESNAISKLARSTESGQGTAMYITHMPCLECAKLIHQSGIESVYYGQKYRDDAGLQFLQQSKVAISMLDVLDDENSCEYTGG